MSRSDGLIREKGWPNQALQRTRTTPGAFGRAFFTLIGGVLWAAELFDDVSMPLFNNNWAASSC
jgi:hypothetical protein